jgi:hypothetical protein
MEQIQVFQPLTRPGGAVAAALLEQKMDARAAVVAAALPIPARAERVRLHKAQMAASEPLLIQEAEAAAAAVQTQQARRARRLEMVAPAFPA